MTIKRSDRFTASLLTVLNYISVDSKNRAREFKSSLKKSIEDLPNMPYKYRKSIYFDDENIRDYIFMGYCIPYIIQKDRDRIVLIDIIKWKIV